MLLAHGLLNSLVTVLYLLSCAAVPILISKNLGVPLKTALLRGPPARILTLLVMIIVFRLVFNVLCRLRANKLVQFSSVHIFLIVLSFINITSSEWFRVFVGRSVSWSEGLGRPTVTGIKSAGDGGWVCAGGLNIKAPCTDPK